MAVKTVVVRKSLARKGLRVRVPSPAQKKGEKMNWFYNIIKAIKVFLIELIHPESWIMVTPYSDKVEKIAQEILSDPNPKVEYKYYPSGNIDLFNCCINDYIVWIANDLYGLGLSNSSGLALDQRPTRASCRKLYKLFKEFREANPL